MKSLLFTVFSFLIALDLSAQGTVYFQNRVVNWIPSIDAPIFDIDGSRLEGNEAWAQLYVANISDQIFMPIEEPIGFLTGVDAGYINIGQDALQVVQFMAPGAYGFAQIRAWKDTATWEQATFRGESNILPVHLGSLTFQAPRLEGLESFRLVPEPGTVFLAVLGGAILLLSRPKT